MSGAKSIREVLHDVQLALKVPKSEWNDFGKYRYRNAESILQSVKELLPEGFAVIVNVRPEVMNGRFVCIATAAIEDGGGQSVSALAYAVEPDSKKGMDSAQLSGATISYAKKYALANLFAIDGTEDSDAQKPVKSPEKPAAKSNGSKLDKAMNEAMRAAAEAVESERAALVETFKRYKLALAGRGAEVTNDEIVAMVEKHVGKPRSEWAAPDYAAAREHLELQIGGYE